MGSDFFLQRRAEEENLVRLQRELAAARAEVEEVTRSRDEAWRRCGELEGEKDAALDELAEWDELLWEFVRPVSDLLDQIELSDDWDHTGPLKPAAAGVRDLLQRIKAALEKGR